jgi:hypothetical protein
MQRAWVPKFAVLWSVQSLFENDEYGEIDEMGEIDVCGGLTQAQSTMDLENVLT